MCTVLMQNPIQLFDAYVCFAVHAKLGNVKALEELAVVIAPFSQKIPDSICKSREQACRRMG